MLLIVEIAILGFGTDVTDCRDCLRALVRYQSQMNSESTDTYFTCFKNPFLNLDLSLREHAEFTEALCL